MQTTLGRTQAWWPWRGVLPSYYMQTTPGRTQAWWPWREVLPSYYMQTTPGRTQAWWPWPWRGGRGVVAVAWWPWRGGRGVVAVAWWPWRGGRDAQSSPVITCRQQQTINHGCYSCMVYVIISFYKCQPEIRC